MAGGYISPVDTPIAPSARQASIASTSAVRSSAVEGPGGLAGDRDPERQVADQRVRC